MLLFLQRHIIHNDFADKPQVFAVVIAENDVAIGHVAAVGTEDELLVLFVVEKSLDGVIAAVADNYDVAISDLRQFDLREYGDNRAVADDVVHAFAADGHEDDVFIACVSSKHTVGDSHKRQIGQTFDGG